MAPNKLVAGNWKMHGVGADLQEARAIAEGSARWPAVDVALCLPATLIERAARALPGCAIGAQDVHHVERGAHTGCLCAAMLLDAGAQLAIVGHSERRDAQRESDSEIRLKAEAALRSGLRVILCVGESLDVRESGSALASVSAQVDASLPSGSVDGASFAVAYEPIWAIGTGRVAECSDIAEMHAAIRERLVAAYGDAGRGVRILYGGSVKPDNAVEILGTAEVGGALVGGASLTAAQFLPIVEAGAH